MFEGYTKRRGNKFLATVPQASRLVKGPKPALRAPTHSVPLAEQSKPDYLHKASLRICRLGRWDPLRSRRCPNMQLREESRWLDGPFVDFR